jgi:lipoprotein-anchoring transpeptidase ErfK/SrfK
MSRKFALALLASASLLCVSIDPATAQSGQPVRVASNMGGGFIEFLFGEPAPGGRYQQQQPMYEQQPDYYGRRSMLPPMDPQQGGGYRQEEAAEPSQRAMDPKYNKQLVDYHGKEGEGTIVIDTPNKFLYLVQGDGKALRYGVGVGRPGFTWSGTKTITAKKEWPAWTPPPEMLARRPDLPRHMVGGQDNPLGARAMYLGSTLYRIHGSNEPWTIGTNVSSGCIRMRNEDVMDLYGRVGVGTRVVVM